MQLPYSMNQPLVRLCYLYLFISFCLIYCLKREAVIVLSEEIPPQQIPAHAPLRIETSVFSKSMQLEQKVNARLPASIGDSKKETDTERILFESAVEDLYLGGTQPILKREDEFFMERLAGDEGAFQSLVIMNSSPEGFKPDLLRSLDLQREDLVAQVAELFWRTGSVAYQQKLLRLLKGAGIFTQDEILRVSLMVAYGNRELRRNHEASPERFPDMPFRQ